MTKFTFIGDPLDGGRGVHLGRDGLGDGVLRLFGHTFPKGQPVEVTDAFAIGKLRGNRHFVEGDAKPPAVRVKAVRPVSTDAFGVEKDAPSKADFE